MAWTVTEPDKDVRGRRGTPSGRGTCHLGERMELILREVSAATGRPATDGRLDRGGIGGQRLVEGEDRTATGVLVLRGAELRVGRLDEDVGHDAADAAGHARQSGAHAAGRVGEETDVRVRRNVGGGNRLRDFNGATIGNGLGHLRRINTLCQDEAWLPESEQRQKQARQ